MTEELSLHESTLYYYTVLPGTLVITIRVIFRSGGMRLAGTLVDIYDLTYSKLLRFLMCGFWLSTALDLSNLLRVIA